MKSKEEKGVKKKGKGKKKMFPTLVNKAMNKSAPPTIVSS